MFTPWITKLQERFLTLVNTNVVASRHIKREEFLLPVVVRHSKTPELNLNFILGNENVTHSAQGKTAFWGGGNFLFRISEQTQRESKCLFHKLQILISQTTDSHFANYRFSFRSVQNADCRLQTGYKMQTRYKMQTADCRPGTKCRPSLNK